MKKRKLSPQQKQLAADFEKLVHRHSKPLELGAKAKAAKSTAQALSKRGTPLVERNRVNKQSSVDTGWASTELKARPQYTGDKVLGLSQMAKSNLVPVFNTEAIKDITKMRRG